MSIGWWLWPEGPAVAAWPQIHPNIAASLICWGVPAIVLWFARLRPHLKAQAAHREAEASHRKHVTDQLAALRSGHAELCRLVDQGRDTS